MLSPDDIPQADNFDRVLRQLREGSSSEDGRDARDLAYYRHAARALGWLDSEYKPTARGLALAALDEAEARVQTASDFAATKVARAWIAWSGVERLSQLDEDTAEDFLAECSGLSSSTAARRARTLKSWLRALRAAEPKAAPRDQGELELLLAGPLTDPSLPTRMLNWAERNGIRTLVELVAKDPRSLLSEKNLGRKSIADTEAMLQARTGRSWLELRSLVSRGESQKATVDSAGSPPIWEELSWDQLAHSLPESARDLPLVRLELPTRMRNYCEEQGLTTLLPLLSRPYAELKATRNLGRGSLRDTQRAVVRWLVAASGEMGDAMRVLHPAIEDYPDFFALWRQRLAALSSQERLVITQRIGIADEAATLESVGTLLGVTRERARQLEMAAVKTLRRDAWWIEGIEARLEDALTGGAVSLAELSEDPWFRGVDAREDEFRYFLRRLAKGQWSLDLLSGDIWLSHATQGAVERSRKAVAQELHRLAFPCAQTVVTDIVQAHAPELAPRLAEGLLHEFETDLHKADQGGAVVYTGFGQTRQAAVLAYVRASREPVSIHAIEAQFGRGGLPDELVHVRRGAVTVPQNIPGFTLWQERLVPACLGLMRQHGPERQWSAEELMELLPEVARLPEWLTGRLLAGMLRLSGQLVYLGRQRVSLPEAQRESRVFIHDVARKVLLDAGTPLSDRVLRERVEAQTAVTDLHWSTLGTGERGGLVRVAAERLGLIERDVPGGEDAFAEAAEILRDQLLLRQTGLSGPQALEALREADPRYTAWTRELVHAVGRSSALLRTAHNGSLGLVEWDDVRVPTQREVVREALDEAQGKVALESILDRIEQLHATRPTRAAMVNVVVSAGARLQGPFVVDVSELDAALKPAQPAPNKAPGSSVAIDLAAIPNFPGLAVEHFQALVREPIGSFEALKEACRAHVREFEEVARSNEFVSVREARQLAELCQRLIDGFGSASETERRLAWATARYFVTVEDADSDFSIGGLDDDIAVANAIACYLGRDAWCISLES